MCCFGSTFASFHHVLIFGAHGPYGFSRHVNLINFSLTVPEAVLHSGPPLLTCAFLPYSGNPLISYWRRSLLWSESPEHRPPKPDRQIRFRPLLHLGIAAIEIASTRHVRTKNQGSSVGPYGDPGIRIGTGTVPSKIFMGLLAAFSPSPLTNALGSRTTTPHSQLRQFIFGLPVPRSFTKRPL